MKDFTVTLSGDQATMSLDTTDSLQNNVWLSLVIRKGSLFVAPYFGSQLHDIRKISPESLRSAETYVRDALMWLVTSGRITSINSVTASRDENVPNRMVFQISVTRASDEPVQFDIFYPVV